MCIHTKNDQTIREHFLDFVDWMVDQCMNPDIQSCVETEMLDMKNKRSSNEMESEEFIQKQINALIDKVNEIVSILNENKINGSKK